MMELYKKHRPTSLGQIEGNESTVLSLNSALGKHDVPHAILFTGPSGCGKTTLARIMAAELGCEGNDLREVDSADFRGIDCIREIRRQMVYVPMVGKCRVWILDECHKLTNDAQNSLLKGLEETPPHVYLMLATTDPQKLIGTVVSRCTNYGVRLLGPINLLGLLKKVTRKERKRVPNEVLDQIAKDALGSPRAALVVLHKIIDLPRERMLEAAKQKAAEENQIIDLCRALFKRHKWPVVAKILRGLKETAEPENVRRAVLNYCATVLSSKDDGAAFLVISVFKSNFFDSGYAGLVAACYDVLYGE